MLPCCTASCTTTRLQQQSWCFSASPVTEAAVSSKSSWSKRMNPRYSPPAHLWEQKISESFYAVSISSFIDKVLWGPTDLGRLESDTAEPPLKDPPQDWGKWKQTRDEATVVVNILCGYDSHFLRGLHFLRKFLIFHAIVKGRKKLVLSVSRQMKLQNLVKTHWYLQ